MILATSASPRPAPFALVVTKGSKMCGRRSDGIPLPLSRTVTSNGRLSRLRLPLSAHCNSDARTVAGRQHDLAIVRRRRIGRVAHDVHEGLDEAVAVAGDRGQRRIEILDDAQATTEARLRDLFHAVEHLVDVHRRSRVSAIGSPNASMRSISARMRSDFVTDQLSEGAVCGRHGLFQKLRGAADSGERILDLVREDSAPFRS